MREKIGSVVIEEAGSEKLNRQYLAILRFIYHFGLQFGYPPTVREIGLALEISSTSMVNYYLRALDRRGYIQRTERASRSLRLLEAGYRAIRQIKPADLQAEVARLLAENRILQERCECLRQERDRLLDASAVTMPAS